MKTYINQVMAIVVSLLLLGASSVTAEERSVYIELPESGTFLEFPMSEKEIQQAKIREDTKNGHLFHIGEDRVAPKKRWVEKFELPESGNYVEFLMTDEEIRLAKESEKLRKADSFAVRASAITVKKRQIDRIELPESGLFIEFESSKE